jgi:hypothetical protein
MSRKEQAILHKNAYKLKANKRLGLKKMIRQLNKSYQRKNNGRIYLNISKKALLQLRTAKWVPVTLLTEISQAEIDKLQHLSNQKILQKYASY